MLQLIFSLSTLWWLTLFLYIPACFGLIIIVLLQKGKGQGLAGAFGMGGGMDTIFGPRSSKSLPQKITYASAAVFMTLALFMSILSGRVGKSAAPEQVIEAPQATMDGLFNPDAAENTAATTEEGLSESAAETTPVTVGDGTTEVTVGDESAAATSAEEANAASESGAEAPLETELPVAASPEEASADAETPTEAPADTVTEAPAEADAAPVETQVAPDESAE